MAESSVQVPPNSTGAKLRTEQLTIGGQQVHQEVITLADADGTLALASKLANLDVALSAVSAAITAAIGALLDVDVSDDATRLLGHVTVDNFPAGFAVVGNVEVTNDVGNPLPVSGTVSVSEPVSVDDNGTSLTVDQNAAVGNIGDNVGNSATSAVDDVGATMFDLVRPWVFDGTNWDRLRGTAGAVHISDGGGSITVDGVVTVSPTYDYAEDSPAVSGDVGAFILGVRNDAAAARTSLDGDYSPLATDAAGRVGITDLGGSITVDGVVALDASTLAALETITVLIASGQLVGLDATTLAALENIVVSGTVALDATTLAALETVNAVVSGTVALDATTLAALESITAVVTGAVTVSATDLDIRDLSLAQDSVRQTLRPMLPVAVTKTGPLTGDVLVAVAPGSRLRVLRNAGHADPAISAGTYPVVTLKIGATTIFADKLEGGLPWGETVCFEGADGEDLTLDLTGTSSVYLNLRYELFAA